MPLRLNSAPHTVFCRALNYDMFLKDLSNSRVSTNLALQTGWFEALFSAEPQIMTQIFSICQIFLSFFRCLSVLFD